MEKAKSFSTENRLKQAEVGGAIRMFLIIQFLIGFAFALAICVSAGYYLFNIETESSCSASNKENGGSLVDVDKRFK